MKRYLGAALFLGLAACGTPQERCIDSVTRDMNVVDKLIAEAQGNLQRGYAFANVLETHTEFVDCTPKPTDADPKPRRVSCLEDVPQTVSRPVAIDLKAEAAKLAGLQSKRKQLATAASSAILACQRQYPE